MVKGQADRPEPGGEVCQEIHPVWWNAAKNGWRPTARDPDACLARSPKQAALAERGDCVGLAAGNVKQLVQIRDFEDFHQIGADVAKLELGLVGLAALVQRHELAEHRRRHEFHGLKVHDQFVVAAGLERRFQQFLARFFDDALVNQSANQQMGDEHIALVCK
jgi:hypothetical protein